MSERDELERLRRENLELDAQLKQLVRAERELYVARRTSERQLRQMRTLSDFAIRVSALTDAPAILDDAARLLMDLYPFEQGLGALTSPRGAAVATVRALRGCEEDSAARLGASRDELVDAAGWPEEPFVASAAEARARMPGLVSRLETLFAPTTGAAPPDDARLLALPLRRGSSGTVGVLLLRRLTPHPTFHERLPGDDDRGFLEVLGRHAATALVNARLLADLRQSYDRVAAAQAELVDKERLAAVGEVAALLAHEVRNPLGAMFNSLSLLRRSFAPEGEAHLLLDIVAEEADRLNRLVEDVLTLASPAKAWRQREALAPIVAGAVDAARRALAPHEPEIVVEVEPAALAAPVDAAMLRRALVNLLLNAAQAAPDGVVRVRVYRLERAELRFARIDVEDEGPGMDADLARRVFQPFFTTRATGTGLGLAVVQRIAEAHRGVVGLATAPGRGSTFSLELPQDDVSGSPPASSIPPRSH
ncbi:MAG: hypothetical protein HY908_28430 [Myxococcales bacterium]|nr:hypothetical protein [Myxococcales bacterium]